MVGLALLALLISGAEGGFAVRGTVRSLAGRVQAGVAVQALGAGGSDVADQTLTDASGEYRLRDLAAGKDYVVKVKAEEGASVSPAELKLTMPEKDVEDASFVLYRPPAGRTVCGTVEVDEALRTAAALRVELHRAGTADGAAPLDSTPIDFSRYFEFRLAGGGAATAGDAAAAGNDFVLRLVSNVSQALYDVHSEEHAVSFAGAGAGSLACTDKPMAFEAPRRSASDTEVAPPALTLFFLLSALVAFFNRAALQPHVLLLFEQAAKQMPFLKNGFINLNRAAGERQASGAGLNGKRRKR